MSEARDVYGQRGFGGRQGAGRPPALVVIDFNYAFTDPSSPLHCDTDAAVAATARLLEAARTGARPVASPHSSTTRAESRWRRRSSPRHQR